METMLAILIGVVSVWVIAAILFAFWAFTKILKEWNKD